MNRPLSCRRARRGRVPRPRPQRVVRDGLIADPPDALREGGADISVEYTSTIHAEMKAALKMRAINTLIEMASMLANAKPEALDKIDVDKIVDEVARVYPGAAAFLYRDKDVKAMREARTAAQQQQIANAQYAEMMKNAGANAKALSETKVGNANALELMLGGAA